ncbi:MAG: hypothetical protein WB810_10385 [Candidatus Cybelea sp.]
MRRSLCAAGNSTEQLNVPKDVVERARLQRNDAGIAAQTLCGSGHDFVRNRANGTEFLRNDQIRLEAIEQLRIEMIEARSRVHGRTHVAIDLLRRLHWRSRRCRELRQCQRLGRKVALVRNAHYLRARADPKENLGRARQKADDLHLSKGTQRSGQKGRL